MTTPNLGAPELVQSQAVPETTVNEIARYLETGANHFRFLDRNLNTPPGSPSDGDTYHVGGSPTGAWSGQAGKIAFRMSTSWLFITPKEGMTAYVADEDALLAYNGTTWGTVGGGGASALGDLSDVDTTGVSSGQVLAYDGSQWEPTTLSATDTGIEGSDSVLRFQYATGSSGTIQGVGIVNNNAGTAGAPSISTTNRLTRAVRHTRATAAAAGSSAGLVSSQQSAFRDCGMTYDFRGGVETLTSGMRLFIGMKQGAMPGNVEPSTLTNIVGFGRDTADTNIFLMHNDASGTATRTDTGIALAAGDELYVRIHCTAGGNFAVTLKQFAGSNLTTTPTATYTATVSTDIPAASQGLNFVHWINNAATASAAVIAMIRESLRTPF